MSKQIALTECTTNENYLMQTSNSLTSEEKSNFLTVSTFFEGLGYSQDRIDRLSPTYVKFLYKEGIDFELMSNTLFNLIDVWDSPIAPTVAMIINQYKILKSKNPRTQRNTETEATTAASNFWNAYNQCRESGVTDIGAIAKYLERSVTGRKKTGEECKHGFCDGKKFIIAYTKDKVLKQKCEAIFRCKCSDVIDSIPIWDNQKGYTVCRGFNPELTQFEGMA